MGHSIRMRRFPLSATVVLLIILISACSPKRYAVNTVGDMLAAGDSVYESDDDIILVGEALPFSLKLVESLLVESPEHRGLLLTASRGYVLYAYAYVHYQAERASLVDVEYARALRRRATKLYLRGLGYAIRALDLSSPGFDKAITADPVPAVLREFRCRPAIARCHFYTGRRRRWDWRYRSRKTIRQCLPGCLR